MDAADDDDRAAPWLAWMRAASAAWPGGGGAGESDPIAAAVAGFERFANAAAGSGDPAHALAAYIERILDALPENPRREWYALPVTWAAAWPGTEAAAEAFDTFVDTATRWSTEFLELPALGPQREWIALAAAVQRARLDEQRAASALLRHQRSAIATALRRYADWLRDDSLPPVASLRALFDAWVAIADAAHREVVMQAAYGEVFAAHVNAMSARRAAEQAFLSRCADSLGLPQRGAFDALAERHAALRVEVGELRDELARLRAAAAVADAAAAAGADRATAAARRHGVEPADAAWAAPAEVERPKPAPATPATSKEATSGEATSEDAITGEAGTGDAAAPGVTRPERAANVGAAAPRERKRARPAQRAAAGTTTPRKPRSRTAGATPRRQPARGGRDEFDIGNILREET